MKGKPLNEVIGKDLADKILTLEPGVHKNFTGPDLKVGGEGMSSFYDKELVNELNKYAKQWGVKVEQLPLEFGNDLTAPNVYIGPEVGYDKLKQIYNDTSISSQLRAQLSPILKQMRNDGVPFKTAMEREGSPALAELIGGRMQDLPKKGGVVHALPITPRMREEILGKGQPLFSLGAGLAGGALAEKLAQPRDQTLEQRETGKHLTRMTQDAL